ncbi:TetR/AcrR family transcriptional regulator [Micromonospora sp. NPDC047548]|uniref:TetR/AcrR family transcriptional regulator n=1 Tax=Micromonospora sp. NPDC047548 TaxID=3155624 RepID=UPI0033D5DA26
MGNREDLLEGAKRCLHETGYARTTARDIATAAGVSLAAIGYHYGTKESLLNTALLHALEEWGEELGRMMAIEADPAASPAERLEAVWEQVLRSFAAYHPLWSVQFEVLGRLNADSQMRETFAAANRGGRLALAELFGDFGASTQTLAEERALALGTFYQAMLGGVASQWLVDPDSALSGAQFVEAVRALAPGLT